MGRKNSRKHAFVLIYQAQFHEETEVTFLSQHYLEQVQLDQLEQERFENEKPEYLTAEDNKFIMGELHGTLENLEMIDKIISENLIRWTIDRISKVDLSILRLAIYELKFVEDIPVGVAISEAMHLAREFSDDESPNFINGILGKISQI